DRASSAFGVRRLVPAPARRRGGGSTAALVSVPLRARGLRLTARARRLEEASGPRRAGPEDDAGDRAPEQPRDGIEPELARRRPRRERRQGRDQPDDVDDRVEQAHEQPEQVARARREEAGHEDRREGRREREELEEERRPAVARIDQEEDRADE